MVVLKLRRRTTMGQVDEVNALIGEVGGRHGNAAHRAAHLSPTADGADGGRGVPPAACLVGLNNTFRGGRQSSSESVSLEWTRANRRRAICSNCGRAETRATMNSSDTRVLPR